jgi:hypothetical protein
MQDLPWLIRATSYCKAIRISHYVFGINVHFDSDFLIAELPVPDQTSETNRVRREGASIAIEGCTEPISGCV